MKKEELFEILGKVDDELLEQSEQIRKKQIPWQKISAIAACFLLLFVVQNNMNPKKDFDATMTSEYSAPMENEPLDMAEEEILPVQDNAAGEQKARAFSDSSSALLDPNPIWRSTMTDASAGMMHPHLTQNDLATPWKVSDKLMRLPVYKNPTILFDGSPNKNKEELVRALNHLGDLLDIGTLQYKELYSYQKLDMFHATAKNIEIAILQKDVYDVVFTDSISLPSEITLSSNQADERIIKATKYLMSKYSSLANFENPKTVIEMAYDVSNQASKNYFIYDNSGSLPEQLLNYHLNRITFVGDAENPNGLKMIHRSNYLANLEYIGDFDIITLDEAKQKFRDGQYVSSVPESFQHGEIAAVEIAYIASPFVQYQIPYYLFYVQLLDENGNAIKEHPNRNTYGYYYIPAVTEEFWAHI